MSATLVLGVMLIVVAVVLSFTAINWLLNRETFFKYITKHLLVLTALIIISSNIINTIP